MMIIKIIMNKVIIIIMTIIEDACGGDENDSMERTRMKRMMMIMA
jgi:hypothetical protein